MSRLNQKIQRTEVDGDLLVANGDIYYGKLSKEIDIRMIIEKERNRLKDQSILPWFSDSKKYRALFPELFICPNLKGGEASGSYDILKNYCDRNIAILGEAGAGKTTLFIYYFVFDPKNNLDHNCIYLTAKEALNHIGRITYIERICQSITANDLQSLTILIDGIDEEFLNDYKGYIDFFVLLKRLSSCYSCSFWLGCRKDLFDQYRCQASQFVCEEFIISSWKKGQALDYIKSYESIVGCEGLLEKIRKLTASEEFFDAFSKNPFQLSLLVYIADRDKGNNEDKVITTVYELYDEFFEVWFSKENLRGTTEASISTIIYPRLQDIAKGIYANANVLAEKIDNENSAIRNLVIMKRSSYKGDIITAMYHRSIVSFLMAQLIFQNMLDDTKGRTLAELFRMRIQDDVTNFIGSRCTNISIDEKEKVKSNLIRLYYEVKSQSTEKDAFVVMEKCIYHLTRMNNNGVDDDVTEFLLKEIEPEPKNPYLRLTLAYGCALSDNETVRAFALKYAKSISNETSDAVVNRAWTLVYFGDIVDDPYTYKDDTGCSWSKARAARIKRFIKKNPRLKDYRFQLFDLPLIYSFLKNRKWNDISKQEYQIINSLSFPNHIFLQNEIVFLNEVKINLLKDYRFQLQIKSC